MTDIFGFWVKMLEMFSETNLEEGSLSVWGFFHSSARGEVERVSFKLRFGRVEYEMVVEVGRGRKEGKGGWIPYFGSTTAWYTN